MYTELEVKALNSIGAKVDILDNFCPDSTSIQTGDEKGDAVAQSPILWNYFITVAFPTGHKFKMKHKEYCVITTVNPNGFKYTFDDIKYGECSTQEQYNWIIWKLERYLKIDVDKYDIFFEHTFDGHIHFHGRIKLINIKHIKDIKLIFHRMFGLPAKHKFFCDVKLYDESKWNNYDTKTKKTYQTSKYPHFKNI